MQPVGRQLIRRLHEAISRTGLLREGAEKAGGKEKAVIIKGEVKCYFCGFVSGELVGEAKGNHRQETFKPVGACPAPRRSGGRLRCCRCGGPVYLEDITVVKDERGDEAAALTRGESAEALRERVASN